ncbi:MAG TPA: hypothetical protein VNE62_08520 [Actinomycetota bacterium]|nr:hypothetical protein [Actinomycetota bacterium]
MRRISNLVALVLISGLLAPAPAAAAAPPGCVAGGPAGAATSLVSPHARLGAAGTAVGFPSAIASDPVFMGHDVEHRMISVAGLWCGVEAFDLAWALAGRTGSAADRASAFATVAGTPWFGDVTVRSAATDVTGVVRLVTHGSRNGVLADWTVAVDAMGVRSALWRATHIGVAPFEAEIGGLTALPGASRSFSRSGGLVRLDGPLVPAMSTATVELQAEVNTADGFKILIRNGDSPIGVVSEDETGVHNVDIMKLTRDAAASNYQEFLDWGMEGRWADRTGTIGIDDALSLYCIACVQYSDGFNIHMSSRTVELLEVLGFSYPDASAAFTNVLGHEMWHTFQMGYWGAEGSRGMPSAVTEGHARFQETLHSYSQVSHQPGSLVYALSDASSYANSCNGYFFVGSGIIVRPTQDAAVAAAMTTHSYDMCLFWMSWYATNGMSGFVSFMESDPASAQGGFWEKFQSGLESSAGDAGLEFARFGARLLSDAKLEWGPAVGGGPVLDWSEHLRSWTPGAQTGPTTKRTLGGGGIAARPVVGAGTAVLSGGDGARLYLATSGGNGLSVTRVGSGDAVGAPAEGDRSWLIAVNVGGNASAVTFGTA